MLKNCMYCWIEFDASVDRVKCCSIECASKLRTKYDDKICPECWASFHPLNSNQIFCSKECRSEWIRYDCVCVVCSKHFKWRTSFTKYCSDECKKEWGRENNKECICEYCWEPFYPWHKWGKYCSDKCKRNARKTIKERQCPICLEMFKPVKDDKKYCSKKCYSIAQSISWNELSKDEQKNIVSRMQLSNKNKVSKINISYWKRLFNLWYDVSMEFPLNRWKYYYDLKIWNTLIEINPRAYHNSTRTPKWNAIDKMYHYNKAKCAINNWYNIILLWNWMSFDELVDIINNLHHTEINNKPTLHRYNKKTKEHIIDDDFNKEEMINRWFVEIYDAWEQYIFNSTNIS